MFKRDVLPLDDILSKMLREEGLETPLLQKRIVDSWEKVAGEMVSKYTLNKFIKNQTLCVHLSNPALRSDLSMMKTQLVKRLNDEVGSVVIYDLKFY
jgi:predicted nucleic acid-binding Zn ribbon protein